MTTPSEDYRLISLTQGQVAIVDPADYDYLLMFNWQASRHHHRGMRAVSSVFMHRLIMGCPPGMVVDHINGNELDNRRSNLRICTAQENRQNSRKHASAASRFKGISPTNNGKKWRVQMMKDKQFIYIGIFDTEEEAARAYDAKAVELFGQFAQTNFPL